MRSSVGCRLPLPRSPCVQKSVYSVIAFVAAMNCSSVALPLCALDHVVGPPQQIVAVLGRDAEHVADHDHRQRRREVADEVALAALAHAVDDGRRTCRAISCSLSRTRSGVKPRLTSLRRFQCSGSSMSIIIGSGPESGRMPPAFENVAGSFDAPSTAA